MSGLIASWYVFRALSIILLILTLTCVFRALYYVEIDLAGL